MDKKKLFSMVERSVPTLQKISNFLNSVPLLGKILSRFVPVANYNGIYNLTKEEQLEWSTLDTYDWFSPAYDYPQTPATLKQWFAEHHLEDVEIFYGGHLVARGKKPCDK